VDLDWRAFERMLQQLRHRGVREIRGDLVLDRSFFMPARADIGVPPFDEAPEFRYNVIPDALLLNTNLLQLDIASTADKLTVGLATPLDGVEPGADMALVDRACEDWEDGWKLPAVVTSRGGVIRIVLQGDFPRDCTASTSINVIDRVTFAERLFRALWSRMGGTLRGRVREGEAAGPGVLVAEHRSRPLADIVRDINKRSDNPIARTIFLTLGALSPAGAGLPTAMRAEDEVRGWLARNQVDTDGLVVDNGSGLSRSERLKPAQLAAVLRLAARGSWSPEFVSSLPIAGVDGTMRRRLASTAPASVRAKTGTLRDTSAIAGYVRADDGELRIVAAIVNHPLATRQVARPILDELLEWAVRQPVRSASASP
jgi:D-alanyl-D-alanine carboxypeptidase/D-alanyl-D-alanine-endopeptidase (penicillin-binding protein 4)